MARVRSSPRAISSSIRSGFRSPRSRSRTPAASGLTGRRLEPRRHVRDDSLHQSRVPLRLSVRRSDHRRRLATLAPPKIHALRPIQPVRHRMSVPGFHAEGVLLTGGCQGHCFGLRHAGGPGGTVLVVVAGEVHRSEGRVWLLVVGLLVLIFAAVPLWIRYGAAKQGPLPYIPEDPAVTFFSGRRSRLLLAIWRPATRCCARTTECSSARRCRRQVTRPRPSS